VLYVPYRAVGVSMQKHQPSYARRNGASVLTATSLGRLLVGPPRWVAKWSRALLLLAAVRSFRSAESLAGRSRPDRPQRAEPACKANKPWHGALWLNALPSHPVRAARITLPRSLRMPWSEEGCWSKAKRGGVARWVCY
jgi:hypothetical protein